MTHYTRPVHTPAELAREAGIVVLLAAAWIILLIYAVPA